MTKSKSTNENPSPISNEISLIIPPQSKDLGGFSVNRILPFAKQRMVGPWIFFDHMGPANFPAGEGIDVRPHPHINLATVTYLFEGEIYHRDSLGNSLPITEGAINLMVAGKGIVHSERTTPKLKESGQKMDGLQLWLALPEEYEEIDPAFYHYPKADIPLVSIDGVSIRVMIGEAFGVKSPVKTFAETFYAEVRLHAGQSVNIPEYEEMAAYIVEGKIEVNSVEVKKHNMVVFNKNTMPVIKAKEKALVAIIGGEKLTSRHIFWNFVSSSKERIEKAKKDWQEGNFPTIDEDSEEFIPLPE